jgi:hypothetical protein
LIGQEAWGGACPSWGTSFSALDSADYIVLKQFCNFPLGKGGAGQSVVEKQLGARGGFVERAVFAGRVEGDAGLSQVGEAERGADNQLGPQAGFRVRRYSLECNE